MLLKCSQKANLTGWFGVYLDDKLVKSMPSDLRWILHRSRFCKTLCKNFCGCNNL